MNGPNDGLVQQLLDTVQKRIEDKVLARLDAKGGASRAIRAVLDEVIAEERNDLAARAERARAGGEDVQAEMYQAIRSDVLPLAADALRRRLQRG